MTRKKTSKQPANRSGSKAANKGADSFANPELKQIEQLLVFMTEHNLEEFEYSRGDLRIRLRKPSTGVVIQQSRSGYAPEIIVQGEGPGSHAGSSQQASAGAGDGRSSEDLHLIKSPIVGTFYNAPSPGAEAFVKVGAQVETGQTLCIVEAMKLMNEIESDASGEGIRVYVENGQPVEYGQPLFGIRPGRQKSPHSRAMFQKILVANRGEIALRVICACKELGISTVAVYSEADRNSLHVRFADEAVCIGPPRSSESYLNIPQVISAAEITNVDAIHPGYGFLSENANFAKVCEASEITFIGPTPEVIEMMGEKDRARREMHALGVPTVPGSEGVVEGEEQLAKEAKSIGFPLIIKASAGGGGRGMRVVHKQEELLNAYETARSEAQQAFGTPDVYAEKFLEHPRHIEFQVLGDQHGKVIHLGERECSIQRRHQKLVEESPSPVLEAKRRKDLGAKVVKALEKIGYTNAGTVGFLMDEDGSIYFIEMNARIQVEHPVTELVTGVDLIKAQIRIAAGEGLEDAVGEMNFSGHAIECRINAEDPETFVPSAGRITTFQAPGGTGVRVDSAAYTNAVIPPYYDSLIAKLIVKGRDRAEAIGRMKRALEMFVIEGIRTSIPLHRRILADPDFAAGRFDTHFIDRLLGTNGK